MVKFYRSLNNLTLSWKIPKLYRLSSPVENSTSTWKKQPQKNDWANGLTLNYELQAITPCFTSLERQQKLFG